MTNRAMAWLVASTLAAAFFTGCGQARSAAGQGGAGASAALCTACHGGASDGTGAPPKDTKGRTATTEVTVGAHTAHTRGGRLAAPIACVACHATTVRLDSPAHMDGTTQIVWSGVAIAKGASPSWDRATASCSNVYCHGVTLLGGTSVPVRWTTVDGSQATCGACHGTPPANHPQLAAGFTLATCSACHPETVKVDGSIDAGGGRHVNGAADGFSGHPSGWLDRSSASFHGAVGAAGTSACTRCHALTAPAHVSVVTCNRCHANAGSGDFGVTCSSCHGSATSAAPPRDLLGNTATTVPGVGAHQSHVTGSRGLTAPMDCVFCHEKPVDVFAVGHMDGVVQLTGSQGWDDAAATCANYCHGATLDGGTATRPQWTRVDGTQSACGSCHGLPGARHLALAPGATAATCAPCHPTTVRPGGKIDVAAGGHMNGRIDSFGGHPAGWMNGTSPDFHGKPGNKDDPACFTCHAKTPPAQGAAFTCADCHTSVASGDWRTACNACHGSPASDAPPRDLLGNTATTFIGVGAHQSHLQGTHGTAAPFDCTACHPRPTDALVAPHLDGRVEVTGYTGTDPALLTTVTDPGWNRSIPSCTTSYCHGASLGGGTAVQPVWTRVDGSQVACGSCHGLPPPGHMTVPPPVTAATCSACHAPTVKSDGSIDAAGGKHVNGTVDTEGIRGHGAGWFVLGDPASHGRVAVEDGLDSCFRCHSAREPSTNGIRSCASCHDTLAGGADWTTSCIGCHGSAASSAPPRDMHGNTATTAIGVGAHRSHVEAPSGIAQRYDCSVCHEKPGVVLSPGHLDGATTVTGYTGADPSLQFIGNPGWDRRTATCATSWCHGGYSGIYTYYRDDGSGTLVGIDVPYAGRASAPTWNQVDGTQAACGSCHGLPPPVGTWHSASHAGVYNACDLCHPGTKPDGTGFTDPASHVNGVVEVRPRWVGPCFNCH